MMENKFVMDELDENFLDSVVDELASSKEGAITKPIDLLDGSEAEIIIYEATKSGSVSPLRYSFKGEFSTGEFRGEKFIMECNRLRCTIVISPKNF